MESVMNKPILAAVVALGVWATTDNPVHAWCKSYFSIGMSASREATGGYYVCTRNFGCNPPPCCPSGGCGYGGPAVFDGTRGAGPYAAYGAAVVPAPAAGFVAPHPAPAAPVPAPAVKSTAQQVGYTPQTVYGYAGYGYGYGYGYASEAGYNQAPSYWYGN
jgi:hypothetical protein